MKRGEDCLLGILRLNSCPFWSGDWVNTVAPSLLPGPLFLSPSLREVAGGTVSGRGRCGAWSDTST